MNQQLLSDAEVRDIEDLYLGEDGATPAKLIRAIEALVLQRLDDASIEYYTPPEVSNPVDITEALERYADDPDSGWEYDRQEADHG